MIEQISKISEIKELYKALGNGTRLDFIASIATALKKNPQSMRTHWFSGFWKIDEEHQDFVLEKLVETLKKQENF